MPIQFATNHRQVRESRTIWHARGRQKGMARNRRHAATALRFGADKGRLGKGAYIDLGEKQAMVTKGRNGVVRTRYDALDRVDRGQFQRWPVFLVQTVDPGKERHCDLRWRVQRIMKTRLRIDVYPRQSRARRVNTS